MTTQHMEITEAFNGCQEGYFEQMLEELGESSILFGKDNEEYYQLIYEEFNLRN